MSFSIKDLNIRDRILRDDSFRVPEKAIEVEGEIYSVFRDKEKGIFHEYRFTVKAFAEEASQIKDRALASWTGSPKEHWQLH